MKKILIVEDDEPIVFSLLRKLEMIKNIQVIGAKDGKSGLELALKEKPDLILLDIVMPVMDGIEMLKLLRQDKWGSKVKVVILSNLSDNQKESEARALGVSDYIVKTDWKLSEVMTKVEKELAK